MSFLRRLSTAAISILPTVPSSGGVPARHVPRRATETFNRETIIENEEEAETNSRASWELSDSESAKSEASDSDSDANTTSRRRRSYDSSDSGGSSDSDDVDSGLSNDRFDMMTRHLWGVGERSGWFRDADFDGLVSIR